MTKKKPNKHLVMVIGIILSLGVLSMGFIAERLITQRFYPFSIIIPFIALTVGFLLKKKLSWLPISLGIGMLIYIIGAAI